MSDRPKQVLDFEGGCNFRDLGGYAAADGRRIKHGVLFRSGVMAYLTPNDQQRIADMGITMVCDLRRSDERAEEPTRWPESAATKFFTWDDEPDMEQQGELSWNNAAGPEQAHETMVRLYRRMPIWLENRLRGVFDYLIQGQVPLLFHCAAGKDRTGLTAALIMHSLGVERETILLDYQLTNHAVDLVEFLHRHKHAGMGLSDAENPLNQIPADIRDTLVKADVAFLSAALEQIELDFGSIDNFLHQRFAVTPAVREQLQAMLLTD